MQCHLIIADKKEVLVIIPCSNSGATTGTVNGEKEAGDERSEKGPRKKAKGHK